MTQRIDAHYHHPNPWSTRMELDYITRMGSHRHGRGKNGPKISRARLLRRYIRASAQRNWGKIDGRRAMAFARAELMREAGT